MKGILFSILTMLFLSSSAYAVSVRSGDDLLNACEAFERNVTVSSDGINFGRSPADAFVCYGFMIAVQQLSQAHEQDGQMTLSICAPPTSMLTQLIRVFLNYARAHPEELHHSGAQVAIMALQSAFPCH
jgi:hypothetical protein